MNFGGPDAGFTIEEGSSYGVLFHGCSNLSAENLWIWPTGAYQDVAGLKFDYCSDTVTLKNSEIRDQDSLGIYIYMLSDVSIEETRVANVGYRGIYVDHWSEPRLEDVEIDSCETGLMVSWASVEYDGGDVRRCDTGILVDIIYAITFDIFDVDVEYCDEGIIVDGGPIDMTADNISCSNCTTGLSINSSDVRLTNSDFYDIYDVGITATSCSDTLYIGRPDSLNNFWDIDGDAILLGSSCKAVVRSVFDDVSGTAINCNTGGSGVIVQYSDIDGTGCFEGITTSGTGTSVLIRDNDIYDYSAHVVPSPRGVNAQNVTADLGTTSDYGNNDFHNNALDLRYSTKKSQPDSLYAVGNWWGEDPPDTLDFGGRWKYIVYEPYLGSAPRLVLAGDISAPLPDVPFIHTITPNPATGRVDIHFSLSGEETGEILIWDVLGRLTHKRELGPEEIGAGTIEWDGRGTDGRLVPSGTYFCRLRSTGRSATSRIVLAR